MKTLGERLKRARENKGMSQVYVAKLLGVTSQSLSNYERNERDPDTTILNDLAKIYGVTTDYLLGDVKNVNNQQEESIEQIWPEVTRVLRRAGRRPTEAERRRIAKIIELSIPDNGEE
jgi:transcriptional regulator with XRE-family HTH domain